MREISAKNITDAVASLAIKACCQLPEEMLEALKKAEKDEPSPVGKEIIGQLIENAKIASEETVPICQDTGLAFVFFGSWPGCAYHRRRF